MSQNNINDYNQYNFVINFMDNTVMKDQVKKLKKWMDHKKYKDDYKIIIGSGDGMTGKNIYDNKGSNYVYQLDSTYPTDTATEIEFFSEFDIHINNGSAIFLQQNIKYLMDTPKIAANKLIILMNYEKIFDRQRIIFTKYFGKKVQVLMSNKASLLFFSYDASQLLNDTKDSMVIIPKSLYHQQNGVREYPKEDWYIVVPTKKPIQLSFIPPILFNESNIIILKKINLNTVKFMIINFI